MGKEKAKICIDCGCVGTHERKRCKICAMAYNRKRARDRNKLYGRHFNIKNCVICNNEFKEWGRGSDICTSCIKIAKNASRHAINKYIYVGYEKNTGKIKHEHSEKAKTILKRNLIKNEVVHHLDGNPKNNDLSNLIVMPRKFHTSLHVFLERELLFFYKNNLNSINIDNYEWISYLKKTTMIWLQKNSVVFYKLDLENK